MGYLKTFLLEWGEGPFPETLRLPCKIPNIAAFPTILGSRRNKVIIEATGKRGQGAAWRGVGVGSREAAQNMSGWEMSLIQIPYSRLNHKPGSPRWLEQKAILFTGRDPPRSDEKWKSSPQRQEKLA